MSSLSSDTLINPQDLFDISVAGTTNTAGVFGDGATLGCLATTGDGRYFRYVVAGAVALVPGTMQASVAETTANERLAIAPVAAGSLTVTTTSTITTTAGQYVGGYLQVASSQGYNYQIASHTVVSGAVCTFTLVDPIVVTLTTGSTISLVPSPYLSVIQSPTSLTGVPVGVAVTATPATYYGWVQMKGPACVLAQATMTVGNEVCVSTTTAGAVTVQTGSLITPTVGYAIQGITATQYGPIHLNLP